MNFVMIDRLLELQEGERARFVKCCSLSEDFYMQHFPGLPIMPGALILEAFVQAATIFLAAGERFKRWPVVRELARARFHRIVQPGDRIEIDLEEEGEGRVRAEARVDDRVVARAQIDFAFVEPESQAPTDPVAAKLRTADDFLRILRGGSL